MADVTSLGVHTPAGLPYLINEDILPAEPKKELYQWDIYAFPGDNGMVEEEILATKDHPIIAVSLRFRMVLLPQSIMAFKALRILASLGPGANQKQRWLGRAFTILSKTREGDTNMLKIEADI